MAAGRYRAADRCVCLHRPFFGVAAKYGDVTTTYIKGAKDIRFGVDIKGGVNVTFVPSDGYDATDEQLDAARLVIENRLVALNVTDYELYVDNNSDSLILEFPWQSGETDFDPESAIQEIGTTAYLTFREGASKDGELILDGSMVESASAQYGAVSNGGSSEYYVALKFTTEGAKAFGDATTKLAADKGSISIWLDDENVSTATVNTAITDGQAIITSSASNPVYAGCRGQNGTPDQLRCTALCAERGQLLHRKPQSGRKQPWRHGAGRPDCLCPHRGVHDGRCTVCRGFLACIALAGQVAATLAFVSGYFSVFESFTLTLPGIAGIILAIGMGVACQRHHRRAHQGGAVQEQDPRGRCQQRLQDGPDPHHRRQRDHRHRRRHPDGRFGPTDGFWAKVFNPIFYWFGPSTAGTIYSFGPCTLLTSVLLNFVFGVWATRVMIRGAVHFKPLRNAWLFGGKKEGGADFKTPSINFIGNRKKFYTFSCALIAVVLVFCGIFGVKMDVEFKGGSMITLAYEGRR